MISQDDLDSLNERPTFSLESIINQILWDAQIEDDYLDEAREAILSIIEKASPVNQTKQDK